VAARFPPFTEQDAKAARRVAIQHAKRRAENGDPVLSIWSQYEAVSSLIDEMSGGQG